MTVPLVLFFVLPHAGERDLGYSALHQLSSLRTQHSLHVHLTESCRRVPCYTTFAVHQAPRVLFEVWREPTACFPLMRCACET
jgi:hypothetical protein